MSANNKITTIKLNKSTKKRLDSIKEHKRESYEEVLQKILLTLNICKVNPLRARARLIGIDRRKRALQRASRPIRPRPIPRPTHSHTQNPNLNKDKSSSNLNGRERL